MLGLSRLAYSLATNRQIPSAVGRLHPTRSTPYVADRDRGGARRRRSCCPLDLDFLVGIFAFGALLGLTIAHLSIIVLRFREPDRAAALPDAAGNVTFRGGALPLPAVARRGASARWPGSASS